MKLYLKIEEEIVQDFVCILSSGLNAHMPSCSINSKWK